MALVEALLRWIETETNYREHMAILVSHPDSPTQHLPPVIDGCVPDVFARDDSNSVVVIGEAKTAADIETRRSREQLTAYLQFLSRHSTATLVLAVPWYCVNQIRSLVRVIQKRTETEMVAIVILEKLPG